MIRPPAEYLRSSLHNKDGMPVAWQNSLAVLLGIAISLVLGLSLDNFLGGRTLLVSAITGMFLSLLALVGPFFMALRLILGVGLLMIVTTGLAVVAVGHAWLAVLGMVVVVFCATVWTAIPLVGTSLGTFPTMGYLIILAKGEEFTGGASAGRVALASAVGLLSAIIVLFILSGRDLRKVSRSLVAKAWGPQTSGQQQGSVLMVLRLDFATRELITLCYEAILARIARGRLDDEDATEAFAAGVAAQNSIAVAIVPSGPLVPREVDPSIDDAMATMVTQSKKASGEHVGQAWTQWHAAIERAVGLLAGRVGPSKVAFSGGSLTKAALRSVLRPESASFRYGVQRALALGVAVFIMVRISTPDFYWVLLTIFSVLQTNASATLTRAAQYAFGTWIGAVAALGVGLIIPQQLAAYVAAGLLIAGFAWMTRNYMAMCVAIAAAVVLLVGSPDGDYLKWAGLRALDVAAGALIAIAVSTFVLRVRPDPNKHVAKGREALLASVDQIRLRATDPTLDSRAVLGAEARFMEAVGNLRADIDSPHASGAASAQLDALTVTHDQVLAFTAVVFEGGIDGEGKRVAETRMAVDKGLDKLDNQIKRIQMPTEPAVARGTG
ncbi:MAG: FUSC family protein [Candidatus Nanopelagicales bacterium]